jgi:hypothetical protein
MAGRSRLLDKGRELILVYPEVTLTNARGDTVRLPSETPVEVWVTASAQRQGDAEIAGQVSIKSVRCIARSAPVGSWAKVVYQGEEWDLAVPPRFTAGLSRATQHVEFILRSRNRLDENL